MQEFRLPDVGEGLHEAEILRWLVSPGAEVTVDQPMVEVQTDKAVVEIGAPVAGTIGQILAPAGAKVPVGTVLVTLLPGGAAPGPAAPAPAAPGATAPGPATPGPAAAGQALGPATPTPAAPGPATTQAGLVDEDGRPVLLAPPSVRKAARDLGVDLWQVMGTGPAGRVTMGDLQAHVQATPGAAPALADPPAAPPTAGRAPAATVPTPDASVPTPVATVPTRAATATPAGPEEEVPLQGLRRRIAERMTESWRTIPHVTAFEEVDATRLVALRELLLPAAAARGTKLTYLPLVIKAVVVALKEHPYLNATFDEGGGTIRLKRYYHVGVATATPDGLLVPVVRDADRKSMIAIAAELEHLAEGARSRKLAPGELSGSTFTISNFGSYGGTQGTPIINPPEVAILGVGKLAERPAVQDGQVVIQPTLPLSLSFDHRVIDGEGAGRFMNRLCALLRAPELLILELV